MTNRNGTIIFKNSYNFDIQKFGAKQSYRKIPKNIGFMRFMACGKKAMFSKMFVMTNIFVYQGADPAIAGLPDKRCGE